MTGERFYYYKTYTPILESTAPGNSALRLGIFCHKSHTSPGGFSGCISVRF